MSTPCPIHHVNNAQRSPSAKSPLKLNSAALNEGRKEDCDNRLLVVGYKLLHILCSALRIYSVAESSRMPGGIR